MASVLEWVQHVFARTSPWVGVLVLLLVLSVGLYAGLRTSRFVVARRVARSRRLGRSGEVQAFRLLQKAGFQIVAREATARGRLWVDGVPQEYLVRVDALVEHRGRRYVAELKGGPESARVTNRMTRRQLLEYAWVFDVDGVLLVDGGAGRIRAVRFRPDPT